MWGPLLCYCHLWSNLSICCYCKVEILGVLLFLWILEMKIYSNCCTFCVYKEFSSKLRWFTSARDANCCDHQVCVSVCTDISRTTWPVFISCFFSACPPRPRLSPPVVKSDIRFCWCCPCLLPLNDALSNSIQCIRTEMTIDSSQEFFDNDVILLFMPSCVLSGALCFLLAYLSVCSCRRCFKILLVRSVVRPTCVHLSVVKDVCAEFTQLRSSVRQHLYWLLWLIWFW